MHSGVIMATNHYDWDPSDPSSWARVLGLVETPAFGVTSAPLPGVHSVMLDGPVASFLMSVTDDREFAFDESPVSWSWSANLRHSLVVHKEAGEMFLRRWDSPAGSTRHFRFVKTPAQRSSSWRFLKRLLRLVPRMSSFSPWRISSRSKLPAFKRRSRFHQSFQPSLGGCRGGLRRSNRGGGLVEMPEGWRRDRTRCGRWRFHDRTERFVKADQGDDPGRRAFQPFLASRADNRMPACP